MVEAPPLCERVLRIVARKMSQVQVAMGEAGIGKLAKAELVACEETRSRCGGQYLRCHAGRPRAVRYGMERGMPHVLCFLGERIAQQGHRLDRCQAAADRIDRQLGRIDDRLEGRATGPTPPPSRCGRALCKSTIPIGLGPLPRAKFVHPKGLSLNSSSGWT